MSTHVPTRRSWQRVARGAWVGVTALNLALFIAAVPFFLRRMQTPCLGLACLHGQLSGTALAHLTALGVSLPSYALGVLLMHSAVWLVALFVAAIIFWRRPTDWAAFAVSLFLITLPPANTLPPLTEAHPSLLPLMRVLGWVTAVNLPLVFYTFPDGRFVPGWTRWVVVVWAVLMLFDNFNPKASAALSASPLFGGFAVFFFISLGVAQILRFLRVSSAVERQQIKWVVFGAAAGGGLYALLLVTQAVLPSLSAPGSLFPFLRAVVDDAFALVLAVSLGVAILRYRLWDIDLLINRALVYTTLTAALAALYFGSVIAFEAVLRSVIGQSTGLATVASTLLLAAVFGPLRQRVQAVIDRRFFRRKYDTGRVLAAFGATMRSEVDLDRYKAALLAVVADTVQPREVSLWLRE
jgi:hypothetical protein